MEGKGKGKDKGKGKGIRATPTISRNRSGIIGSVGGRGLSNLIAQNVIGGNSQQIDFAAEQEIIPTQILDIPIGTTPQQYNNPANATINTHIAKGKGKGKGKGK